MLTTLTSRVRSLARRAWFTLRRSRAEADLRDELAFHLDEDARSHVAAGASSEEAERAAHVALGGVESVMEACRDVDRLPLLDAFGRDVSFGLRMLRRRPVFAVSVLLVLALGLGAATTVGALAKTLLIDPLPYPDPGSLVRVIGTWDQGNHEGVSPPDLIDLRRQSQSFARIAAATNSTPLVSIRGSGEPEMIPTRGMTSGFFATLGIRPVLGREFTEDEEAFRGPRVVILGYAMWQHQFNGAPDIVGKSIPVNGAASIVVGVVPPFLDFAGAGEMFTPVQANPVPLTRGVRNLLVIGRLKPGLSVERAAAEVRGFAQGQQRLYPEIEKTWSMRVARLDDEVVGGARRGLFLLLGAVALLLLLMTASVAGLVLSQSIIRSPEVAVRMALGGSRGRIVAQLVTESMLICILGGIVGCAAGALGVWLLRHVGPSAIPRLADVVVDWRVVAGGLTMAATIGALVGLEPAWRVSGSDVADLTRGARTTSGRNTARSALVFVQVAVCVVLLTASGLLVRSIQNLQRVDPGFRPQAVLTARLAVPPGKFSDSTGQRLAGFWDGLLESIATLPGVTSAAITSELPLSGLGNPSPRTVVAPGGRPVSVSLRSVSSRYGDALGVPLRAGRFIETSDRVASERVVVINAPLARDMFAGENPIGRMVTFNFRNRFDTTDYQARVVGVVDGVHHSSLATPPEREAYLPASQSPLNAYSLIIRTSGASPMSVLPSLRALIATIDPTQAIGQIRPMTTLVEADLAEPRFRGYVVVAFAVFALTLAAGGLYGLLAVIVAQRSREIGIRIAVGACPRSVASLVVGAGFRPAFGGAVAGVIASAVMVQSLRGIVFGVTVWDTVSFTTAPALLVATAALAAYGPVRRALSIDPAIILRLN
jgi:putative ABC transport system permease protein